MRSWLTILTIAALAASGCGAPPAPPSPAVPRDSLVVLVTIDAFRPELASGGFARFDAAGTRFAQTWSVAPLSRPSLATLMTGVAPDRTGVRSDVLDRVPEDLPTLATRFREAGWTTAAIVGSQIASHVSGLARGFDFFDGPESLQVGPEAHAPRVTKAPVIAERFTSWLSTRPADRPAFVWVHLADLQSAAPSVQGLMEPMEDYRWTMNELDQGLNGIADGLASSGSWERAEIVIVGLFGVGTGDPHPAGAKYWLNDDTLRTTLVWKSAAGSRGALPPPDVELWLPDVPQTLLGRFGLPAFSGADGLDRIASPRDDGRTLRAWNWALDDDLAWPTLTAVRVGGVWDVFEWGALSGGPAPEDSLAQATARERPAVPRERRLSDATKARFASLGIPTTAIAVRGARVTPPAREPFLADVLRVRRALSYGNTIAARKASRRIEEAAPDNVAALSDIAYHAILGGAVDEAEVRARRAVELYPDREEAVHNAAHLAVAKRDLDRGEALILAARDLGGVEADLLYDEACVLALRGDVPGSVALLDKAIAAGYRNWVNLEADGDLAGIRASPEFSALLRRHGR